MAATEKQLKFIAALKDELLSYAAEGLDTPLKPIDAVESLVMRAALALALPAPADAREASAQIDALKGKGVGLFAYARQRPAWAQALGELVAQRLGTDVREWPARIARDPRFVTEYRPGGEVARVQDGEWITPASLRRTLA
jgi:hypothetical protein